MLFSKLAAYLEKLEGTASRNEMTVILADLYKDLDCEETREVTYLICGTLGPAYRTPDFGIADKQMLKALKPSQPTDSQNADEIFKRLGDIGLVAETLHTKRSAPELSCHEVYKALYEIAVTGGVGSQEKKLEMVRNLLKHMDSCGAKYVVKIVLGKLRTGFSDMTILDALSWMVVGDKSLRKNIEAIYNVRADLGEIAEIVKSEIRNLKSETNIKYQILEKSEQIQPEIGTPILMAKAERASSADEIWERNGACALEYKLDGLRIQAHISKSQVPSAKNQVSSNDQITLFSRGMEDMTKQFPEIVQGLNDQLKSDAIVEGEVIAVDPKGNFLPFQETIQRKRKHGIAEMSGKIPLKMFLYEILYMDGKSVMHEPNEKRRVMIEDLVIPGNTIKIIERRTAKNVEDIETFFDEAIDEGTEGIIAKRLDGPYQAGSRDFNWIKYKRSYDKSTLNDTIDAVVMGYDFGQGKRSGFGIGDFLIGVYDENKEIFVTIAKIGTGLSDEEWKLMKSRIDETQSKTIPEEYVVQKSMNVDVWANPKIVVEVKADEITKSPMHSSGYALRFPRLISWREKRPHDATSLKEVVAMFEKQGK